LEAGDLFHVDSVGSYQGYYYDVGRTCVVGGKPTGDQISVMEAAIAAVDAGIAVCRPGVEASVVYEHVDRTLREKGMATPSSVSDETQKGAESGSIAALAELYPAYGHGYGLTWEWPLILENEHRHIESGMCLAIEVMTGTPETGSAYFEENIIVHDDRIELLSLAPKRYW
jgi:Xaa-Pro aminopeptidase